ALQWPFKAWGASVVVCGHDHVYERLIVGDLLYLTNGLGGRSLYEFTKPIPGSRIRYDKDYGAMKVEADEKHLSFQFITRTGDVIDSYTLSTPRSPGSDGK